MKFKQYFKPFVLLFAIFLWNGAEVGVLKANTNSPTEISNLQPLTEVLKEISEKYQVIFSYETTVLSKIKVDFTFRKNETVNVAIDRLLSQTGLRFQNIGKKYFIIHQDTKESNKSARKIKKKLKQIQKLEGKGKLSLKRVQSNEPDRLSSIVQSVVELKTENSISGTVTDEEGEALIGVTIQGKGTSMGTITDLDGKYELNLPADVITLMFSYTGYRNLEVNIDGRSLIDVQMTVDVAQLDEVVVVGYKSQKKANLTGAVVSVKGDAINKRPITQGSQALQGVASGVFINTNSGEPGVDAASINIRGIGTLNDSNPLVLIDGIEGPLNSINSNDIESINVLKDAASASIYGTRAANGVILITTKRGAIGTPSVSYNAYHGVTAPTVLGDNVTDTRLYLETFVKAAEYSGRNHPFTPALIDEVSALGSKDWLADFVNTGSVQNHDVAISGGTENIRYRWSTSYLDQNHYLDGGYYLKRLNSRLNLDFSLSEKIKSGVSMSFVNNDNRQATKNDAPSTSTSRAITEGVVPEFADSGDKGSFLFTILNVSAPNGFVYDEFGRYGGTGGESTRSQRHNPQALIDNQWVDVNRNEFLGNAFVEYEPLKGLKFKYTSAVNFQQESHQDTRLEHEQYDRFGNRSALREAGSILLARESSIINYTNWLQATYTKSIGNHNFNFLAGINEETSTIRRVGTFERGFGSTSLVKIGNGTEAVDISNFNGEWGLRSFFGRLNYDFGGKYLLEANIRRDGSSRFGSESRWATFPGVSVGYVLSKEDFWKGDYITFLKFRGSWGRLGVQSSNLYPFASEVVLGTDYDGVSGASLQKLGNEFLSWEATTINDIGIDVEILRGKISFSADYYVKESTGILTDLANPLTSGIDSDISINAASIQNKGFDLSLNARHNVGDLKISAGVNVTNVKNKVLEIDPSLAGDDDRRRAGMGWWIRGEPINSFFGHESGGIYQVEDFDSEGNLLNPLDFSWLGRGNPSPGDIIYTDQNNDNAINEDDMVVIGNPNPEWLYGFNLDLDYKGFDFGVLFQGIGTANSLVNRYTGNFGHSGLRTYWLDGWTEENRSNTVPRIFVDRDGWNGGSIEGNGRLSTTDTWIIDRAYLRLKNIVIGYSLPKSALEKLSIDHLRVYVSGQNLLTKSKLVDLDPERNAFTNHFAATMPQAKVVTFGINVRF